MINLLTIIGLGFLLGMRHATDGDHVIAVSTIVSRERNVRQAALIGVAWGAGHTLTILGVGSAMILFRIVLPPRVGLAMELAVALMLVLLGLRNMGGLFGFATGNRCQWALASDQEPVAPRQGPPGIGSGRSHDHAHSHSGTLRRMDGWFGKTTVYQVIRPLVVGIVHGLAGSAAIALLVLSTIQSARWAVAYLLVFGVGTILGMMLITMTLASALSLGQKHLVKVRPHFGVVAGAISLAFGLFLAYQVGFVNGLFTAHASWVPH